MSGPSRRRVAILGGGMAGVAAAWRLSEPGWEERFERITIYQRGARLGGKGASHRGANGRVEEHGLHIWLGYYDNAFRLLRECYEELDRPHTDPRCPIRTVDDALHPATQVGLEDWDGERWHHWLGDFAPNDLVPGHDDASRRSFTGADIVRRALRLLADFYLSVRAEVPVATVSMTGSPEPPTAPEPPGSHIGTTVVGAAIEALGLATAALERLGPVTSSLGLDPIVALVDRALAEIRTLLVASLGADPGGTRLWNLVSVVLAQVRGIIAEGLLDDPDGFTRLNDEDYRDWIVRHGADPVAAGSTLISGLYDLVFGFAEGDPDRPGFGAGLGVFLSGKTFFDYKGSIFWKMQAGMGDVVFAPLHEALRARGVRIEYFSRLDDLHLDESRRHIDAVTLGRQVRLAPGRDQYDPLVRVKDLPCFPERPLTGQLDGVSGDDLAGHDLESFWCEWPDAEQVVLRRGVDFDDVVFAIPPGMARHVCGELVADRPEWRAMVDGIGTVATQALQIWLRSDEPSLGWDAPGSTMSGYVEPFDTWASMPQLVAAEDWPAGDAPRTIAYFCNTLATPEPADRDDPTQPTRAHAEVRRHAERFLDEDLAHLLPGAVDAEGFRWDELCGAGSLEGPARLDTQYWRANIDPSDRYVQSLPGTDRLRLRADGSGYANLFLAGDWTDNGLNAGCIEGAVLSGLHAANALMGRPLGDRTLGVYLPLRP